MLIHKAIEFATLAHVNQVRKSTGIPYIVHPIEASLVVSTIIPLTWSKESKDFFINSVAATLLHDTVEDTNTSYEELEELFGLDVADIVLDNTEDKSQTWEQRKQHTIMTFHDKRLESQIVSYGDKLSNLRSLCYDFADKGEDLWKSFARGKEGMRWYYTELKGKCFDKFKDYIWFKEFENLYIQVFN